MEDFQEKIVFWQMRLSDPIPAIKTKPRDLRNFQRLKLEETYKGLDKTLEGRASTLTYDESKELLDAFDLYVPLLRYYVSRNPSEFPSEDHYHRIFDKLEALSGSN